MARSKLKSGSEIRLNGKRWQVLLDLNEQILVTTVTVQADIPAMAALLKDVKVLSVGSDVQLEVLN